MIYTGSISFVYHRSDAHARRLIEKRILNQLTPSKSVIFFGTEPCSYQGRRPLHSPPLFSFLTGSLEVVATLPVCWLGWTEHWSGAVAELGRAEPLALHGALV